MQIEELALEDDEQNENEEEKQQHHNNEEQVNPVPQQSTSLLPSQNMIVTCERPDTSGLF